ncbi:class I SAM-dependent methyltransferase [Desulfosediminicola sp.]|uniref:class I SAM-dependent methyltransferase n=1 Tax=Desulfosediminicola sp. TaxID=2886825 RepID=UPI003AF2E5C6
MQRLISATDNDPLGAMMLAHLDGTTSVSLEVESTTLEMSTMTGEVMFRDYEQMDELEKKALSLCKGKVLDVGAGSGSHSLFLQQHGLAVDAIDISPGAVEVMQRRGVKNVAHTDLYSIEKGEYQTLLFLMNGLGLCGTLEGLRTMLCHAATIITEGGQIIADSTDLSSLYAEVDEEFRFEDDVYYGETEFVMRFGSIVSEPFPWLYVDFATLLEVAEGCGLGCEKLLFLDDNRYLVRLSMNSRA